MRKKCAVLGCLNHTDEGTFIGELCMPCYEYLTILDTIKRKSSQAYRNDVIREDLEKLTNIDDIEIIELILQEMKYIKKIRNGDKNVEIL